MSRSRSLRIALSSSALLVLVSCGGGGGGAEGSSSNTESIGGVQSPDPSAPSSAACGLANFRSEMLRQVNARRSAGADCGTHGSFAPAGALAWNASLESAAAAHSADMAARNFFAHVTPDGVTMADRANAAGYAWSALAENIAAGQATITKVVDGWMASDGHCANIMDADLRDIAVACVASSAADYPTYWTMDLGKPR